MKKSTVEEDGSFATASITLPIATLKEIEGFFPIGEQKIKETYAVLVLKIKEINAGEKEITFEGKKKLSKKIDINSDYTREEVIFYTYALLHAEYDWDSSSKDSNLKEFCHDFFTKAKDYTHSQDRENFDNKYLFEMFLFCSVKNEEEYNLPPYEELWRVFLQERPLLPTTYKLLFTKETNSIRKKAIAEKGFAQTSDFYYLQYILSDLFKKKQYRQFVDLFIAHEQTVKDGGFPYYSALYFNFIDSCRALADFETLRKHIWDEDVSFFGGRYSRDFIEGISAYYQEHYVEAEEYFKKSMVKDVEGSEVTRGATVFYISCLLKQKKTEQAKSHIFDLQPREPYLNNYSIDDFDYPKVESTLIDELKKLDTSKEETDALTYYEASLTYDWQDFTKKKATEVVRMLKPIERTYDSDCTYYFLLSEALFVLGSYDEAYEYKLQAIDRQSDHSEVSYSAHIKNTSNSFQDGLAQTIEEAFQYNRKRGFTGFIESEAQELIAYLWREKKYSLIVAVFDLIEEKGFIDDVAEYLFEFAFSLKEEKDIVRAQKYYEYYIEKKGENQSVLNNLAIIYEQSGNIKLAKNLIEKAFKLSKGSDSVVNRNRERLIGKASKKKAVRPEKKMEETKDVTDVIEYDLDYGKLLYRGSEQKVRSSKLMPAMLKILFEKPQKAIEAITIFETLNLDELSEGRSLLDCVRQINGKLQKLGIKEDVFDFRSEKVLTKESYINRLRTKVSKIEST